MAIEVLNGIVDGHIYFPRLAINFKFYQIRSEHDDNKPVIYEYRGVEGRKQ
jgi:hypothetical protein